MANAVTKPERRYNGRELDEVATYLAKHDYERREFLTLLSNKTTQRGSHIDSLPTNDPKLRPMRVVWDE